MGFEKKSLEEQKEISKRSGNDRSKSTALAQPMQNGDDDFQKGAKRKDSALEKQGTTTRSLTAIEPLEPLTTSTAETGTTGASSTAGTATTTSATDTNTDNATTTEDDDDDIPLAVKKSQRGNGKKKGKKKGSKDNKTFSASENDSQEEMEIATSHKGSAKDEQILKAKQNASPSKINKPKGLVDSLSKYFTPGG